MTGIEEDLCHQCLDAIYPPPEKEGPETIGEALLGDDELDMAVEAPNLTAEGLGEFLATTLATPPDFPVETQIYHLSVDFNLGGTVENLEEAEE